MNNLSISQEYTLLSLTDRGSFSHWSYHYVSVCLVAATISDLSLNEVVEVDEKNNVTVINSLSQRLNFLSPLYEYLKEKETIGADKIISNYCLSLSRDFEELYRSICNSLELEGLVVKGEKSSLLGKSALYYPENWGVENIIQKIRAEVLEDGVIADETIMLCAILDKGKQLKQYFSMYEEKTLKEKIKLFRESRTYSLVKKMMETFDTIMAVISIAP